MQPNFIPAGQNQVLHIFLGTWIPTAVGSIFVLGRMYTRAILKKLWGADDSLVSQWGNNPILNPAQCNESRCTLVCEPSVLRSC